MDQNKWNLNSIKEEEIKKQIELNSLSVLIYMKPKERDLPSLNLLSTFLNSYEELIEKKRIFKENQHQLRNIVKRFSFKRFSNKEFEELYQSFTKN